MLAVNLFQLFVVVNFTKDTKTVTLLCPLYTANFTEDVKITSGDSPAILMLRLASRSRFSALRSRCTTWRLWQYATADTICRNFRLASRSFMRPWATRWSETTATVRRCWQNYFLPLFIFFLLIWPHFCLFPFPRYRYLLCFPFVWLFLSVFFFVPLFHYFYQVFQFVCCC